MERKFRVLFVCVGNAIRSQMAEAFARSCGSDVLIAGSAGVYPATNIMPLTRKVLWEKNVDLGDVFPKGIADHGPQPFDLVVNLSGMTLPAGLKAPVREWNVKDPMGMKEAAYRGAADQIAQLVQELVLELRQLREKWRE
ncbi:MAG TPA: hypothetical protein VM120_10300 [Bryobacteraceae bacterium]|nr:hypothetical protein [Bryobacteraceae bacterium]